MRFRAGVVAAALCAVTLPAGAAAASESSGSPRVQRPAPVDTAPDARRTRSGPLAVGRDVPQAVPGTMPARTGRGGPLGLDSAASDVVPGMLLVTTRDRAASKAVLPAVAKAAPGAVASRIAERVLQVKVPTGRERAAAASLGRARGVVAVEQARYRRTLQAPNDPLYPRQWAHQLTNAEGAWSVTVGSDAVSVAIIDNGVDARHPDLRPNVVEQRAFAGGSSYALAPGSDNRRCGVEVGGDHGTHVAGVAGAEGNDGVGVVGVAWDVALLDYAVFTPVDGGCAATDGDVLRAMQAAVAAGADVINLSLGGFTPEESCSTAFQAVIDEARDAGTVVVAAAGNYEENSSFAGLPGVPASCNGAISVGAVTGQGLHAPYSTTNEYLDLVAPGGDTRTGFADGILSTVGEPGSHDWFQGTSMAAPYVAGVVALLRSVAPDATPDQVEALMETTARDLGADRRDSTYGWGLVDAGAAVGSAASGARPQPAADPVFPVSDSSGGGTVQPPPTGGPEVYRVAAGNGTTSAVPQAVATSQVTFFDDSATHAVLARRDDFADALGGSSLTLGLGPLLFSGSTGPLPSATSAELQRVLTPGAPVYLLGGPAALPTTLEAEIRDLGFDPVRLEGRNREETAVAVARALAGLRTTFGMPDPGLALLATSRNWPDAVTAGSLGAYYGIPILLTPATTLAAPTADYLRTLRPDALLVAGGPVVVSESTYSAAASAAGTGSTRTFRIAGSDRYGTAVAMAEVFESLLAEAGVAPRCVLAVNVVRSDAYAHALSASSLAGAYGCVMVPVLGPTGDRLPDIAVGYVDGFGVDGVLAGDVDLISDGAAQELRELLQP